MLRTLTGTLLTRMVLLVSTLCVVVLNTRYLGQEGQGQIALINFGILILVSISNIVGGGALIYLIPRLGIGKVILPAVIWALLTSGLGMVWLSVFDFMETSYLIHIGMLALLQALFFFIHQIILSREQIRVYNLLLSVQVISLLISVVLLYTFFDMASVLGFIACLYISFILTLLTSLAYVKDVFRARLDPSVFQNTKHILKYGFYAQGGNVVHLMNQRGGLYFLNASLFSAGIFSLCLYAAEAIWNVSKSISLVQHSRISNLIDKSVIRSVTISFMKLSVIFTAPLTLIAISIPDSWFRYIFGNDLEGLHHALMLFSPAIILHSATLVFSHYFSGTGLHKHNMWGAILGFLILVALGTWLTPLYGLNGTVVAASAGLLTNFIYHFYRFHQLENLSVADLQLRKSDLTFLHSQKKE